MNYKKVVAAVTAHQRKQRFRLDLFFLSSFELDQCVRRKISLNNPPSGCRILSNDLRLRQRVKDELDGVEKGWGEGGDETASTFRSFETVPLESLSSWTTRGNIRLKLLSSDIICAPEKYSNKSQNKESGIANAAA